MFDRAGARRPWSYFLAIAVGLTGSTVTARADILLQNYSDSAVEVFIQYTQGPYRSNSGFGPGGGDSATMSIILPDSIVSGRQVIPSRSRGLVPTPGNGDVSVCLQVAGRDIIPNTATGPGVIHYIRPNSNFFTLNGRLSPQVAVDTPAAAAANGFVPKPFYRVAPDRPIIVASTYQPTLQPSMNPSPAPMYPKPFFEPKPYDKPFPGSKPSPKMYWPSPEISYQLQQPPPITYFQPPNVPMTASSVPTDDADANQVEAQGESYSLRSNLREFWKGTIFGSLGRKRGN